MTNSLKKEKMKQLHILVIVGTLLLLITGCEPKLNANSTNNSECNSNPNNEINERNNQNEKNNNISVPSCH